MRIRNFLLGTVCAVTMGLSGCAKENAKGETKKSNVPTFDEEHYRKLCREEMERKAYELKQCNSTFKKAQELAKKYSDVRLLAWLEDNESFCKRGDSNGSGKLKNLLSNLAYKFCREWVNEVEKEARSGWLNDPLGKVLFYKTNNSAYCRFNVPSEFNYEMATRLRAYLKHAQKTTKCSCK